LKAWAKDAWQSGIALVNKLASSIMAHLTGVLNFFDHRITTAKVGGINNKIKTLKLQAYGFRYPEYLKLRLYHLHKQNYSLCGRTENAAVFNLVNLVSDVLVNTDRNGC
jgi:hypothetical protein